MADPDQELDIELIKKRTVSGVVTFTLRTFFIQAFTFVATFVLTVLLDPQTFGVFFIVSAVLNLFIYFSDIGLAAALIQKKTPPTQKDFITTFTIQQAIVITLVVLGLGLSPMIGKFYKLDYQGLMLLRVLIFSLLLSSLKTIPSIILERGLNFTRLVIPQVAEHFVFYSIAMLLALKGFGLSSFTYAVLARGVVGLVLIYVLSPWKPSLGFNKQSASNLTRFGLPFQANSILALLKDDLLTVIVGKVLPHIQVGYIGWAQKFAFIPLRFFMDNVIKVTFPAYSRLQENKEELGHAIEKSIFFVTFLVYPSIFGIIAIAPSVVNSFSVYNKWAPALPILYFFAANAIFASVTTTLTNTLFAIGKPKIVLSMMVFWTALTWILTFALIPKYGYLGVGAASALVAASTTITVYFVKKNIPMSLAKNVFPNLIIAILMYLAVKIVASILAPNYLALVAEVLTGFFVYFALAVVVYRGKIVREATEVIKSIFTRS